MAEWLSKVMSKVGLPDARAAVREALQTALRKRCKVYIESPDQNVVALTQVQQIEGNEIVIAVPSIGGMTYPLAFGEALKISFVDDRANVAGATRCLGRVKVRAGDGKTLFAYRIALPEALTTEERRADTRVELPLTIAPEAHLYSGKMPAPVIGRITSISMSGARISTDTQPRGVSEGQELYLKFMLPEPVGLVDEVVEVQRIDSEPQQRTFHVGVTFHRRLERLAALMRPQHAVHAQQQHRRAG
jgi:c-di-GMP-binding flagellar brake protein YcgR